MLVEKIVTAKVETVELPLFARIATALAEGQPMDMNTKNGKGRASASRYLQLSVGDTKLDPISLGEVSEEHDPTDPVFLLAFLKALKVTVDANLGNLEAHVASMSAAPPVASPAPSGDDGEDDTTEDASVEQAEEVAPTTKARGKK
jgi:ribosomal protein L12E/L44/L45/RPP1/RPP2